MAPDETPATLAAIRERQALASDASLGFARMEERHAALIKVAYEDMPRLLAAIEALSGALERHQQWFKDERGVKICGGCLEPVPCPDTDVTGRALAGKDSSDE